MFYPCGVVLFTGNHMGTILMYNKLYVFGKERGSVPDIVKVLQGHSPSKVV